MRRFLMRIGFAVVVLSSSIVVAYLIIRGLSKETNTCYGNESIFVWGDSKIYQGLDVSLLCEKAGKQVLTSARHGAGVYDFMVGEIHVPSNAVCILPFSEAALLRNPESDNNRTGFEPSCLRDLHVFGCPLDECISIAKLNIQNINYQAFGTWCHKLYPYADSLVYPEPLPLWHSLFEEEKDWFSWKAKSYKVVFQHLFDKQTQIILVHFPYDKQVESFACHSINRHLTDSLKEVLIKDYALKYEEIVLESDSLLMHDLSHMNEVGARLFTLEIAEILRSDTVNNYFIEVMIQ